MKTVKCTATSSTSATTLHAIQGRTSTPGTDGERGGQKAARDENSGAPAEGIGREIKGRSIAPGRALAENVSSTWGKGAMPSQATKREAAIAEEQAPAKRRRGVQEEELQSREQHGLHASSQRQPTPVGTLWHSRQALLESLRTGVRPPEGLD